MRAPRRVPWASKYEIAELDAMIYSPSATAETRRAALSRMAVYISQPSCPAFIHLLHALVGADLLEADEGATRLACAMAVVRFVNGLVDPLQTGPYARPISHLAAQLGLPPSLVALRHRATHEDVPPLSLLRPALVAALDYIHRASLLPLLFEPAAGPSAPARRETRADALARRWKRAMKARVRAKDADWENETGKEARRVIREVGEMEADDVVEAVVRVLVPSSKKQRPSKTSVRPPAESLAIWVPLFTALPSPAVPALLADTVLAAAGPSPTLDPSARWALLTWLSWLWDRGSALSLGDDERGDVWRRVARLMGSGDPIMRRMYAALSRLEPAGPLGLDDLLIAAPADDELTGLETERVDADADVDVRAMEARLALVEARLGARRAHARANDEDAPPGWTRVAGAPTPIGVWVEA
ncbi:rRNA-processing protein las1 [Cryptotrichosporon argae]